MDNKTLLKWQFDMGADEAIIDHPRNYFSAPQTVVTESAPRQPAATARPSLISSAAEGSSDARKLADAATSMDELEAAIRGFDGCALKKTASKTVFGDGNRAANVMLIGEAPGADEDRQGIPFCGVSGQLLDKMLAAINLTRENVFISNTVYWRPPGNRQPSKEETLICRPFVEKMVSLVAPGLLILAGGTAVGSLLEREESIGRLRGKPYLYQNPYLTQAVPVMVTYHPSYLLRQPAQKRLAWQDLLAFQAFLSEQAIEI